MEIPAVTPVVPVRSANRRLYYITAIAILTQVMSVVVVSILRGTRALEPPLHTLMRLDAELGRDGLSNGGRGPAAVLSPDGSRLVFLSQSKLFTRTMDDSETKELPGTERAYAPFFSPDGKWVAFFANGRLKKVSVTDGRSAELCSTSLANGGSWGDDGNIIAAVDASVLSRIPASGGRATHVSTLARGEMIQRWPQILPGGQAVLFTSYGSMTGSETANIDVLSLHDRRRKTLIRGGTFGRYAPSGHLLFISKGTLLAVPFDPARLQVRGTPVPVLEGVEYSTAWGFGQLDFSKNGTLIYRTGNSGTDLVTVQLLDAEGNSRALVPIPGNYLSPTVSPDGNRLAMTMAGDIWVYEFGRGTMTRLTSGGSYGNPLWTADGRFLLFRAAVRGIFWMRADGADSPHQLLKTGNQVPWSVSSDGKRLAFVEIKQQTGAGLWTVPLSTLASGLRAGEPEVFLDTPSDERCPMISPDGKWLAYMSNESGQARVYVRSFPDSSVKSQISTGEGGYPAWSRDSHEIFFWQLNAAPELMVVRYKTQGNSFTTESPRAWSGARLVSFSTTRGYDPLPDGKHIVALLSADRPHEEGRDHVSFLLNFFDELRRRVPVNTN